MKKNTNKLKKIHEQKGFTLIELLGVIIILAVIALITYPIVDKSIQRSRESALERTIENIEEAAYFYSVKYDLGYPKEQQILELKELANKGFISDKEHINPVTNNELEGCVLYRWNETAKQYYFKYAEPCVRTEIAPTMTLVYDKENINENSWLNKNIMVNINGTGTKYYYCIGNTECEPNIEENKTNGTKIIINEGTNVLCAKAENAYGESKVVCTEELNLDKTAPNIEGIGDKTVQRNTNVDLITGVTYNDALSGISGELIIEPTIVDTSVTGTKVVKYKITDKAGNTKEATRNIIVDAAAPTITYNLVDSSSVNSNGWAKSNFFVRATITDNSGTGIKIAKNCSTNSSNECTPSASFTGTTKEFSIQTEGNNRICIEVTDNNNKTSKVCSDTYKLDKTLPNIAGVADKTVQRNTTVDLKAGVTYSDALSGISGDLIIEPSSISTSVTGTKTVKYKVTDKAGNTREVTRNIIVDAAAPTITYKLVDSSSVNSNGWAKSNFFVRATITDNSGSGIKTAKSCSSNSSSECTPVASFTGATKDFYIEVEGNNRLCIEVTDNNNKTSKLCSDTYKLDKTAPTAGTATFTGTLGSNSWYTSNVTVNKVNGSDSLSGHSSTTSNVSSITSNTSGTKVTITTTDLAGNSSTRSYTIKIDKTEPKLSAKSSSSIIRRGTSVNAINYFTILTNYNSNLSNGTTTCKINNNVITNLNSLSAGTYTLTCTMKSGAGNTSAASTQIIVKTPFDYDSWSTISSNIKNGTVSEYDVGDTKTINLSGYGNFTVRLANKTTNCTNYESQSACGFVIEFVDIITTHVMKATPTNKGGWRDSDLRNFLNSTIYNSLPTDLKNIIINTTVVSGYGQYYESGNFTTVDKLYLLSPMEVWGANAGGYDSAYNSTRQLDYYKNSGVTTSEFSKTIKMYQGKAQTWWLRTVDYLSTDYFYSVYYTGTWHCYYANSSYGVSPAFRIG